MKRALPSAQAYEAGSPHAAALASASLPATASPPAISRRPQSRPDRRPTSAPPSPTPTAGWRTSTLPEIKDLGRRREHPHPRLSSTPIPERGCHPRPASWTLTNFERFSAPSRKYGSRYVYSHNTGLQNQAVLFWQEGLDGPPQVLIDPNTLAADGTVALNSLSVTHDGALMAYALADAGSDWVTWHVRDITTGHDLLRPRSPGPSSAEPPGSTTTPASSTKATSAPPTSPPKDTSLKSANYFHKIYFHKLGTPQQSEDPLIFERPDDKELNVGAQRHRRRPLPRHHPDPRHQPKQPDHDPET